MDDYNLKLILKSELKIHMPSYIFNELIEESKISNKSMSKTQLIELIFEEYSLQEIKDLILNKYDEKESYAKSYESLLNRIEGLTLDERFELERKRKKEELNRKKREMIRKKGSRNPYYRADIPDFYHLYECMEPPEKIDPDWGL